MSRIGKAPVAVPDSVKVKVDGLDVAVSGPKGELSFTAPPEVRVEFADGQLVVRPNGGDKRSRQMWGMTRTRLQNLVTGVTDGFERVLDITGVGFRAQMQGATLKLALGYSHEVTYAAPPGISIETPKPTEVKLSGADRQAVGQAAAEIRAFRRPEPYKGKGISYQGERIYRKVPRKVQAGGQ